MKRQILFILFFILFAQNKVFLQEKYDFFPLSTGSYYLYKYNGNFSSFDFTFMDSEGIDDSGWVKYSVEGFEQRDTLIIWKIKEKDSVYTRHFRHSNELEVNIDTCFWTVGENLLELTESLTGNHKLSCNSPYGIWNSPINISWAFRPSLYRYKTDSIPLKIDFDVSTERTIVTIENNVGLTSYKNHYLFGGNSRTSRTGEAVLIEQCLTSLNPVKENIFLKDEFNISQNFPNPFNPSTVISYSIPYPLHVTLKVYNLLGREVATLVNEEKAEGLHNAVWKADNISSGVYFYELRAGNFIEKRKMMLIR